MSGAVQLQVVSGLIMEHTEENEADDGQEGSEDFFIRGSSSSEDEGGCMRHSMSCKQAAEQRKLPSAPPGLSILLWRKKGSAGR